MRSTSDIPMRDVDTKCGGYAHRLDEARNVRMISEENTQPRTRIDNILHVQDNQFVFDVYREDVDRGFVTL